MVGVELPYAIKRLKPRGSHARVRHSGRPRSCHALTARALPLPQSASNTSGTVRPASTMSSRPCPTQSKQDREKFCSFVLIVYSESFVHKHRGGRASVHVYVRP